MSRTDFCTFAETPNFKKVFGFKGFPEDFIHYLPKRLRRDYLRVFSPLRSMLPFVPDRLKTLEHKLKAIEYINPEGSKEIAVSNFHKWKNTLLPLLVDCNSANATTGGDYICGGNCVYQEDLNHKLVDTSRIKL